MTPIFYRQRLLLRLGVNIDDQQCLRLYVQRYIPDPSHSINANRNRRHTLTADSNSSPELAFHPYNAPGIRYAKCDKFST